MKIIDFEKKGNIVRFYLGRDDLTGYYGDDWDDSPYDLNAGAVYEEYISGYVDVAFPFDSYVMEPCDDWHYANCPWCKDDMRDRRVPCIIVVPKPDDKYSFVDEKSFSTYAGDDNVVKFYFNDKEYRNSFIKANGTPLSSHDLVYDPEKRTLYLEDNKTEFNVY